MRIGIDIRNIGKQRTGDEVVFFNLTKELSKIDSENEYFLLTDTANKKVLNNIENTLGIKNKENFKIISLSKSNNLSINKFLWNFWVLPTYLRKSPVDIYHTQYITPLFVPRKIKIVTHIHDISFKIYSKFIKWSDLIFLNVLIPMSMRRADKIIAVSEFTKNEILEHYGISSSKVEVVYNSTDLPAQSEGLSAEKINEKYSLPDKFILYVGTLQPRKNIPILIEAYAKIRNKIPAIKLVVAGDRNAHNFDKKIDETINKYKLSENDIIFAGFIDAEDKASVYNLAHTLVAPSFYEGFGITPLEAMEANTPIIVSEIPPHREVSEDAAIYFDPNNLDELHKKLYTICIDDNLRNKLIGLESARLDFFSWKKSAKKLLETYKSLK